MSVFGFRNFSQILIPLQSLMTVTLPPGEGMPSNHDPFPNTKAYIEGIEDTVSFYMDMVWKIHWIKSVYNTFVRMVDFLIETLKHFTEAILHWQLFLNHMGFKFYSTFRLRFWHLLQDLRRSHYSVAMENCTPWCVNRRMTWERMRDSWNLTLLSTSVWERTQSRVGVIFISGLT